MSEDLKAISRRLWEDVWPSGDVEALREILHPDSVNHEAPPGSLPGIEGVIQTMQWLRSAFSDQRYEIHQIIAEGDTVAVHLTHHGRHTGEFMGMPATGRAFAYRHVHIMRFENGLSIEHWAVRDDATMIRQLQAAEPMAS
jgi:steroid delta-isomerase-like uncharacterized protein